MSDTLWKSAERKFSRLLGGGGRIPVSGRGRGSAADIRHDLWSIEVKAWKNVPQYLADALDQAIKSQRGRQIPLAIFHRKGNEYVNDVAVIYVHDLMRLTDRLISLQSEIERLTDENARPSNDSR